MPRVVELLGKAYADEWNAYHQYWVGAKLASGEAVGEFLEHANDERRHADAVFSRLVQLGAKPAGNPAQWASLAGCPYTDPGSSTDKMVEQNIASERCAIKAYRELLAEAKDDQETSAMVTRILEDELEHERDLRELLEGTKTASADMPLSKRAAHPYRDDPKKTAFDALRELALALGLPKVRRFGFFLGIDTHDIYDLYSWISISAPEQEHLAKRLALEAGAAGRHLDRTLEGDKEYRQRFGRYRWEPNEEEARRDYENLPRNTLREYFCDEASSTPALSKRAEKSCWEHMKTFLGDKYEDWLRTLKKPVSEEQCEEELDRVTQERAERYVLCQEVIARLEAEMDGLRTELREMREAGKDTTGSQAERALFHAGDKLDIWQDKMWSAFRDLRNLGIEAEPPMSKHAATELLPISKYAQDPVRRTAESILKIINFLLFRVPQKDKNRYMQRIRGKIMRIPTGQVSVKKMPQTASIGQAISLTKNILSGLNPFFVKRVVDELANMMALQVPERRRPPVRPRPRGV